MPPLQTNTDDDDGDGQIKQVEARAAPGWIDGLSTSSTNADASSNFDCDLIRSV
jgi:hypothetical protein